MVPSTFDPKYHDEPLGPIHMLVFDEIMNFTSSIRSFLLSACKFNNVQYGYLARCCIPIASCAYCHCDHLTCFGEEGMISFQLSANPMVPDTLCARKPLTREASGAVMLTLQLCIRNTTSQSL